MILNKEIYRIGVVAIVMFTLGVTISCIYDTQRDNPNDVTTNKIIKKFVWTRLDAAGSKAWDGIALSSNGTIMYAGIHADTGRIWSSSNSGASWTEQTSGYSANYWAGLTTSYDGQHVTASTMGCCGTGVIITSSNYGASWAPHGPNISWVRVASSSDGSKQIASDNGYSAPTGQVYTSTDYGASWTATITTQADWRAVASSANGVNLAAAQYGGYIYTSSNSGANWTQRTIAGSRTWISLTMSADGTKIAATANDTNVYLSLDSGNTWSPVSIPDSHYCTSVSSSADFTVIALSDYDASGSYVYTSQDYGQHWTQETGTGKFPWAQIACSADGTRIVVQSNGIGWMWTGVPE